MRIAAVQLSIDEEAPLANLERALALVDSHCQRPDRAAIYVLPEMFTCGYNFSTWPEAVSITDYAMEELSGVAKKNYCALSGSIPVKLSDGEIANRMFFYDHHGSLIQTYDKIHLFAPMGEDENVKAGSSISTFNYEGWKVSMLCCFDLRFPVPFYRCALQGTQLFIMCAEWPIQRIETLEILCRARAIETQSYLVMSNRTGDAFDGQVFGGHSMVVDPLGTFNAAKNLGSDVVTMDIRKYDIEKTRSRIKVFEARNPAVDL
jgi:predicted amidohydrolase